MVNSLAVTQCWDWHLSLLLFPSLVVVLSQGLRTNSHHSWGHICLPGRHQAPPRAFWGSPLPTTQMGRFTPSEQDEALAAPNRLVVLFSEKQRYGSSFASPPGNLSSTKTAGRGQSHCISRARCSRRSRNADPFAAVRCVNCAGTARTPHHPHLGKPARRELHPHQRAGRAAGLCGEKKDTLKKKRPVKTAAVSLLTPSPSGSSIHGEMNY